jgi:hypothetical protein
MPRGVNVHQAIQQSTLHIPKRHAVQAPIARNMENALSHYASILSNTLIFLAAC